MSNGRILALETSLEQHQRPLPFPLAYRTRQERTTLIQLSIYLPSTEIRFMKSLLSSTALIICIICIMTEQLYYYPHFN